MAQTTSLVFNGGAIPSPSQAPAGSGKAKLLKIGEITVTEQEVQVTKNVICDPDSVTTVAPFMEVLTSEKLAELVNGNTVLVLDDGTNQYLMSDAIVSVEDSTAVCTSVNFLGLSREHRAKVLYPCTRITDELTLQQVLEVGEPVETDFNAVVAYPEDTEPATLIDKLEIEDNSTDPDWHPMLEILPGDGKVAINEDNLREAMLNIDNVLHSVIDTIDGFDTDSVPHAYLQSSLYQSAGDSVTTRTTIDTFAYDAIEGDCFEFEETTTIDDVPFGNVYIEPGTYLINSAVTLQWVGSPRGTFIAKVGKVMDDNFDFSQEQEFVRQSTKVVTIPNRMKLAMNVTYDAGTPVLGFWIKSMQIVKLAGGMSQTNIVHDDTLAGRGSLSDPLGVDEEKVAQSILAGNLAPAFDPTRTDQSPYIAYRDTVVHEGELYLFTSDHYGAWVERDATRIPISNLTFLRKSNIFGSFFVCDENNNIVLLIRDGHLLTKRFDSSKVNIEQTESLCSFSIKDENGHVVLAVRNGYVVSKNFDSERIVNNTPKNYEKTVGVFGGSLSRMPESEIAKDMWRTDLKMDVTTYGQNGAGFVPRTGFPGIQAQVASAPVKDVYILWSSTNDFSNDQPIGEYTDYTYLDNYDQSKLNTQCGGINYCIKTLTEKNPHCEIYFFTGLDFFTRESGYNPFSTDTNNLGKTYQEYVNAQLKCCELFSVPVFDQNKACGFNIFNHTQYYKDNLHLNEDGYRRLGKMQVEFLSNGLC